MADEEQEFLDEGDVLEVIELADQGANGNAGADDFEDGGSDGDGQISEPGPDEAAAAEETIDNSVVTFSKHTGDVFAVDVSPTYAASGGEDDRAYVWKLDDGDTVFECTGHSDSVTYVRFNGRRTLLATACMAGLVQVWRIDDFTNVAQFQVGDLAWLQWHHAADILFCGAEDGSVWMCLVPNGDIKVYPGYGHSCTAGELFPDGKRLCAGYSDGGVRVWDLKTATFTHVDGAAVHKTPVTCVSVSHDNTLAASGCEEGTANLIHVNSGKILATFVCTKGSGGGQQQQQQQKNDGDESVDMDEQQESISVEALAFSKLLPLLFTGTVNGEAAVWDLNSHVVRQTFPTQEGVVKAVWLDNCVLIADLGGALRLYDARNGELVSQWTGHKGAILDFGLSSDAKTLVSSSADGTCKVFRLDVQR